MKIVIVLGGLLYPYIIGGGEIFSWRLAQMLSHEESVKKVVLVGAGRTDNKPLVIYPSERLEIIYLPLRWFRRLNRVRTMYVISSLVSRIQPDVILSVGLHSILHMLSLLAQPRSPSPVAIRTLGLDVCLLAYPQLRRRRSPGDVFPTSCTREAMRALQRPSDILWFDLIRLALRWCSLRDFCYFIALSKALRDLVTLVNPSWGGRSVVIPNFVDDVFFEVGRARFERERSNGNVRIVYLGRLAPEKGANTLVEIVDKTLRKCDRCVFKIIGDGVYRPIFERLVERYPGRLVFKGFVSYTRVPKELLDADIFILPSRIEGSPNALIQAMASGLAIVASSIPPIQEHLGDAGLYAAPDDVDAFVEILLWLVSDAERRRELGLRAYRRAWKLFRKEVILAKYIALFKTLASRA